MLYRCCKLIIQGILVVFDQFGVGTIAGGNGPSSEAAAVLCRCCKLIIQGILVVFGPFGVGPIAGGNDLVVFDQFGVCAIAGLPSEAKS